MDFIRIIIMAIVQGVGEFLPISSSGHLLVLGRALFQDAEALNADNLITLSILLHAGTLLSVLVYFWRSICDAIFHRRRLLLMIVVASIPTAVIGLLVKKFAEDSLLANPYVAGAGFIVTGVLLLKYLRKTGLTDRERYLKELENFEKDVEEKVPNRPLEDLTFLDSILIGIAQGIAVLPGISRSGLTITAGVARRFNREAAATFSFLLAIPAIGGGALLEAIDYLKTLREENLSVTSDPSLALYGLGAAISFIVGFVSLAYLMRWLKAGKLHYFAYWLFFLGPAVILLELCA
ncbi:MAG: undecaprenyl-diphosphate phosphatase, partial [Thermoguttaceae bacterium]|nr:undecaprenyl-diphosphate phosphatase [Thermoguttaceae bacterium]